MRRIALSSAAAIFLLCVETIPITASQQKAEDSPAQASPTTYPESADGLTKFLEDIFSAMKAGDDTSAYFSNLEIPNRGAWFVKTFGSTEGVRLEAKYEQLLPIPANVIKGHFDYALKDGRTNVEVRVLQQPANPNAAMSVAIVKAMVQPTLVYNADGTSPQEKYPASIGDFVYVEGGFRYIDPQVFQALSTAPPLRIRLGGQVQVAKIVRKVAPIYPPEARAAHITGAVVLHVIIGIDGKVQEITPMSGDMTLSQAAIDAVRQWQYQPTLLNGKAVEVDTTVTVTFAMK
jgi:TonB family protein